jgi:hypothetical protein
MDSVFLLWYVRAPDTTNEDELLIGAYTTEGEAKSAIERLKDRPGFVNAPDGFQIHRYELNRDSWTDGFLVTTD